MACCSAFLLVVQMLALLLSTGLCEERFLQRVEGSVGNGNAGAEGSAEFDPNAELEVRTFGGGTPPPCRNIIDRNMRDCVEEEQDTSSTEFIMGAVAALVLFVVGLVLGVLDYCWAPADNKLAPRFQGPEGWGDGLLAFFGIPIKLFLVMVVIEPVFMAVVDDFASFLYHLMLLGFVGGLMMTFCCPVTMWYTPTLGEIRQQFTHEKKEINKSKKDYVKSNFGKFAWCMLLAPCKLFLPWVFCASGKALFVVVFAEIFFGMAGWLYVLFRIVVSAFTYKLFTAKGWVREVKMLFEIKKRIMALDYPRFNPEGDHAKGDCAGVAGKVGTAGKDAGVAGAQDAASSMVFEGFCPIATLFTVSFSIFCDFFADFVFGFFLQFLVVGFAIFIAEQALEAKKAAGNASPQPADTMGNAA